MQKGAAVAKTTTIALATAQRMKLFEQSHTEYVTETEMLNNQKKNLKKKV